MGGRGPQVALRSKIARDRNISLLWSRLYGERFHVDRPFNSISLYIICIHNWLVSRVSHDINIIFCCGFGKVILASADCLQFMFCVAQITQFLKKTSRIVWIPTHLTRFCLIGVPWLMVCLAYELLSARDVYLLTIERQIKAVLAIIFRVILNVPPCLSSLTSFLSFQVEELNNTVTNWSTQISLTAPNGHHITGRKTMITEFMLRFLRHLISVARIILVRCLRNFFLASERVDRAQTTCCFKLVVININ